jgi:4-amino-4-deoxy-L-arabinose transferase-like glycosyltransferase
MTKFLKLLLLSLFLMQLMVSSGFELAHDEAYYWLFSRHLDWGYFDHPPLVAVVIRMFSFLPQAEWSVRLGFILLQFSTIFLIFKMIEPRYHMRATILFFAFPLASLSGLLALPDMPLLFMTAAYCFTLKNFLEKRSTYWAMILALTIPFLLYAKYHGIIVIFFTILALPKLFKDKRFYLITAVSLLLFLPHLLWQYQNDFVTLRYHFIERPPSAFSLKRIAEFLVVQVGLAGVLAGPLVWWASIKRPIANEFERVMKFISLGTVVFFLISTFSKKFEANWTVFLTIPLIYLSVSSFIWERKTVKILLYCSFSLIVLARLLFLYPAELIGLKRLKEFEGWNKWAHAINKECDGILVANSYQIASKLSYYLKKEVHSMNYQSRKNQFDLWRWDASIATEKVCYITDVLSLQGDTFFTPEGKELRMLKGQSYDELLSGKL